MPIDPRKLPKRVFASEAWYIERPEQEQQFIGILEPMTSTSGPAGRPALSFVLKRTAADDLLVYAGGIEKVLASFSGCLVFIRGKQIDFKQAGFAVELWIGEIRTEPTKC